MQKRWKKFLEKLCYALTKIVPKLRFLLSTLAVPALWAGSQGRGFDAWLAAATRFAATHATNKAATRGFAATTLCVAGTHRRGYVRTTINIRINNAKCVLEALPV